MEREDLKKANEINDNLENIERAISEIEKLGNVDQLSCVLAEDSEVSSWYVELFNTIPTDRLLENIKSLLIKEKENVEKDLKELFKGKGKSKSK